MESKRPSDRPMNTSDFVQGRRLGDSVPPTAMLNSDARAAMEAPAYYTREQTVSNAQFLSTLGQPALVFEDTDGNRDAKILLVNSMAEKVFDMSGEELIGMYRMSRLLETMGRHSRILGEFKSRGAAVNVPSLVQLEGAGARDWLISMRPYIDPRDGSRVLLLNLVDNAETTALAGTDALTGLPNTMSLRNALRREFEAVTRYKEPLSLMFLDIDHFKAVNDTYGHEVGDAVLKAVAKRIAQKVRGTDLPHRNGGEEFVVLLPRTDTEGAEHLAEIIREVVASTNVDHGMKSLSVTVTIGVATHRYGDGHTADTLLKAADEALYSGKTGGRDCVRVSEPGNPPKRFGATG